jgi:hypothetical protein
MNLLASTDSDGGQFARWIGEDAPGTHGTPVEDIDLGIEIVVGAMIVLFIIMCFTKKK